MSPHESAPSRLRSGLRAAGLVGAALALWLVLAAWVVPAIIEAAYHGASWRVLNRLIEGQEAHGLDEYLRSWRSLSIRIPVVVLLLALGGGLLYRLAPGLRSAAADALDDLRDPGLADWALLVVGTGLALGVTEVFQVAVRSGLGDTLATNFYPELWWMAPMALILFLGVIALLAGGLARLVTRRGGYANRSVMVLITATAFYGLLRSLRIGLHPLALALLSLGLGVFALRALGTAARPYRRRLAAASAAAVLAAVAGSILYPGRLYPAPAPSQAAAPAGSPNVLIIILDTVRSWNLGLYGYERETTPYLTELAARSVVFDQAIATAPWTLPSHGAIFTGRRHHELSADWNRPLDDAFPTLAGFLAARGYDTGGFVANFTYAGAHTGLARGFQRYDDDRVSAATIAFSSWLTRTVGTEVRTLVGDRSGFRRKRAARVNRQLLGWLRSRQDAGRPFFAFLNYFDAHTPYAPPPPYDTLFADPGAVYWHVWGKRYSDAQLRDLTGRYDGAIAYMDREIGRLMDELEDAGILDNTLVIVTSDHGEQFGEQAPDLVKHGASLYLPVLAVPLLIRTPSTRPDLWPRGGSRVPDPVSIRDIPATVLGVLGIDDHPFPGVPLIRGDSAGPAVPGSPRNLVSEVNPSPHNAFPPGLPISRGAMKSLRRGRYHYILNGDGVEELYDVSVDSLELDDLARHDDDGCAAILTTMRETLRRELGEGSVATAANPANR